MRIIIIGQAPFGAKTLEALQAAGEDVVAVYTPPDKPGSKFDPLKEAALKSHVRVFQPETYRSDAVFDEFARLGPDLLVLAFVTAIIPSRYFKAATRGAICYHPSLLPRHRGASAINWAIIMGDTRTGLSIFWPDAGIDTGPVLLRKEAPIAPDDTAGSLYFNRLFPMGIEALAESVALIREGRAPKTPQESAGATYEPPCDDRVAAIDWDKSGREVYNLIRGCDPQPGAYAGFRETRVRFYAASFRDADTGARPGVIAGMDEKGLSIAVAGGSILVTKVRPASGGKMDSVDWASAAGVKPGDRFL